MTAAELNARALSRATLARQLLLERGARPAVEVVEHLVGLQAQAPNAPYVGLWSRLDGFATNELATLLTERRVVRTTLMRVTIHLVTAVDCLALRPLVQTVCERSFASSSFRRQLDGLDVERVLATGRSLLEAQPMTRSELGPALADHFPGFDDDSLAYVVTYLLPLVQVLPRGIWGSRGPAAFTTVERWLGRALDPPSPPDATVLRYLGAFGPASVNDAQVWSGLSRLREVVERLRPRLLRFRDDRGVELFDLPDAPRPDPDTPAPPRFLPEYDNVLLSHADRRRVIDDGRRLPLPGGTGGVTGTLLVDGFMRARWRIARRRGAATLLVEPFRPLSNTDRDAVAEEGTRLLAFVTADVGGHDVRFA